MSVMLTLSHHSIMVRAQMLSELEEIIDYKKHADQPDRQRMMRKTWMKRFVIAAPFPSTTINVTFQATRVPARRRSMATNPSSASARAPP